MKLQETRRYQLLSLFIALVFALTMHPTKAQAQIVGNLEADIPFQFLVGNAKLPPGTYTIHGLDNSDPTMMEISSADGSSSALFELRNTEVQTAPAKTELTSSKHGHKHLLQKFFAHSNPTCTG